MKDEPFPFEKKSSMVSAVRSITFEEVWAASDASAAWTQTAVHNKKYMALIILNSKHNIVMLIPMELC
jgi:hypothetical protein